MHRSIIYDQEQVDPFDALWAYKDMAAALGGLEIDLAGGATTVLGGFAAGPTSPASLSINLAAGRIYQQSPMDSTAYGALPSDTSIIQQQGYVGAQSITLSTAGLSAGQSMWALVQAQFSQVDIVRSGDPTNGVLNYWNSANPTQPFQGPNNNGQSQPTERQATVAIQVIYGTPAATGSEVPPNPTNGWVPLYLVDLAANQTTIVSNQILIAGPSVGSNVPSNYPGAPFLAGLIRQHHLGTPGQAPQIDLTAEVKNKLPLANMPASNTVGGIGSLRIGAGNPNGNAAGNANVNNASDFYYDSVGLVLYICTTTGTSSTAVWTSITNATTSIFAGGNATGTVNAQVVATVSPSGFTKSAGQVVTFTGLNNTGSTTLNVAGTGASTVQKNTGSGNVNLTGGELNGFVTVVWTGAVYLLQAGLLGNLSTMNVGQWLKNDGSNNLTIKNAAVMGDDGSGNFGVLPQYLSPVGSVVAYAGGSSPASNWFICNGQAVSRTTYAALFAILGITFGSGDGVTTFNLPDLRGRTIAGVDGGANRLTTNTMSSQALGGVGGFELIALSLSEIPTGINSSGGNSITVTTNRSDLDLGTVSGTTGGGGFGFNSVSSTGSVTSTGTNTINVVSTNTSGSGHRNVQPTMELNYLIRAS